MTITSTTTGTSLADIHPDIIQTHILRRLNGPSVSATATSSSYLNHLCSSDDTLWSLLSRSTWPSITHPQLDHIISTFPARHRSFFYDALPTLTTSLNHYSKSKSESESKLHYYPSQLISAVDIRYQNNLVYSTHNFTSKDSFPSTSAFRIQLNKPELVHETIDVTVDAFLGADKPTLSHLKQSITLSWIIIDPVLKRACNLSSIKPVSARADWANNETHIRFVTLLPGRSQPVQCRIHLVLGVGTGGVGLNVKEVTLKIQDLDSRCLNGMEFLRVVGHAIMGGKNVLRKVLDDEEIWKAYVEFKKMKRERRERVNNKQKLVVDIGLLVTSLCLFITMVV